MFVEDRPSCAMLGKVTMLKVNMVTFPNTKCGTRSGNGEIWVCQLNNTI